MVDFNTCRFIVWGYTHASYSTHTHIHEGIYRALVHMFGQDRCIWIDNKSPIIAEVVEVLIEESGAVLITNWDLVHELQTINPNVFFVVHGGNDHEEVRTLFEGRKNYLAWNVFTDTNIEFEKTYGVELTDKIDLDIDTPFYPNERYMAMRWATDLLPHEIQANKPQRMLSLQEKIIYWVGTIWHVNEKELNRFIQACTEDGVEFKHIGAGQNGVVSIEENINLVRESYMAPAIVGSHHLTEGYTPCRIFKNISYGQMGITNSKRVNDIFGGRLIYNADPYKLYWEAKEALYYYGPAKVWELMDFVAEKHTYVNRINAILEAVKMLQS